MIDEIQSDAKYPIHGDITISRYGYNLDLKKLLLFIKDQHLSVVYKEGNFLTEMDKAVAHPYTFIPFVVQQANIF